MSEEMPEASEVECSLCGSAFHSKDATIVHKVLEHGLGYCEPCVAIFNSPEEKTQHDDFLHAQLACPECPATFENNSAHTGHIDIAHQKSMCSLCRVHLSNNIMSPHLKTFHCISPVHGVSKLLTLRQCPTGPPYGCRSCGLSLGQEEAIVHLLAHHRMSRQAVIDQMLTATGKPPVPASTEKTTYSIGKAHEHGTNVEQMSVSFSQQVPVANNVEQMTAVIKEAPAGPSAVVSVTSKRMPASPDQVTAAIDSISAANTASSSANSKMERAEAEMSVSPGSEYSCYVCHVKFEDSGLHLVLQHGMVKCSTEECHKFFKSADHLKSHQSSSCSQPAFQCTLCSVQLASQYMLVAHTSEEHSVYICILCSNVSFASRSDYTAHLAKYHRVEAGDLLGNFLCFINSSLATFSKEDCSVVCRLCGPARPPVPAADGGYTFLNHITLVHKVQEASHLFPRLYDPSEASFSYKQLRGEHEDLHHDPLVNLNPQIEGAESRDASRSSSETVMSHHSCIVCNRTFVTSEEVQRHLLTEHIAATASLLPAGEHSVEEDVRKVSVGEKGGDAANTGEQTASSATRCSGSPAASEQIVNQIGQISPVKKEPVSMEDSVDFAIKQEAEEEEEEEGKEVEIEEEEKEEKDVEIDDEHYSINHVEVTLNESHDASEDPLELPQPPKDEEDDQDAEEEDDDDQDAAVPISRRIGKAPVLLKCELCSVVLPSIISFIRHMKHEHRGSEQERNRPFKCDLCTQQFFFASSLNAHKSKSHFETSGEKYCCPLCPSVTCSKNGMRRHLKNTHNVTQPIEENLSFRCKTCGEMFFSSLARKLHIKEEHSQTQQVLTCHACQHMAPNKHALRRHFLRMHPSEPIFDQISYDCEECGIMFTHKQSLFTHNKEHHKPQRKAFACDMCPLKLASQRSLRMHRKRRHRKELRKAAAAAAGEECEEEEEEEPPKKKNKRGGNRRPFRCKFCQEAFSNVMKRTAHYAEIHPTMAVFSCTVCGLGFKTKSALYNHKVIHNSPTLFTCSDCNKSFKRRDSYKEHILIHNGPRHKCPHCPKEFVQKSNLNRHVRIHLGIKPYSCDICPMTFSDKGACNSHIRTHTGEERQACEICGVVFSKKQKLKYHMRTHTGEDMKPCPVCAKAFTHSYALNSHLRTHQKKNRYMCYVCKKSELRSAKDLYRHLMRHGEEEFPCQQCDKSFRYRRLLNRHVLAVHEEFQGFKCSAERCTFASSFLYEIRSHVLELHSIKYPEYEIHFRDEYTSRWCLDGDPLDLQEEEMFSKIYHGLDQTIDKDIHGLTDVKIEPICIIKEEPLDSEDEKFAA